MYTILILTCIWFLHDSTLEVKNETISNEYQMIRTIIIASKTLLEAVVKGQALIIVANAILIFWSAQDKRPYKCCFLKKWQLPRAQNQFHKSNFLFASSHIYIHRWPSILIIIEALKATLNLNLDVLFIIYYCLKSPLKCSSSSHPKKYLTLCSQIFVVVFNWTAILADLLYSFSVRFGKFCF